MRTRLFHAVIYTNRAQLSVFCKIKVCADRWVETDNCWEICDLHMWEVWEISASKVWSCVCEETGIGDV